MKRSLQRSAAALLLVLGLIFQNKTFSQYNPDEEVSYQTFYDELSPHGRWVEYPGQGYVWVPDAEEDFQPYSTNGHWVWTDDYEWMWVSDYEWGWAPFHYGRWDHDEYYGWYWVPGYEWSPAWVAWRDGGDYYGWAPLRPGINVSINFNIGGYNPPHRFWSFTPRQYISSPRWHDYCVDRRQNVTIINYTTIINYNNYRSGYGFRNGPRRYEAERYCGRINPVRFRDSYNPGRTTFRNNEVNVYRPRVRQNDNGRGAPQRFERYDRNNGNFRNGNNGGFRGNDNNSGRGDMANRNRMDERNRMGNDRGIRRDDGNRVPQRNNGEPGFERQRQSPNNNPGSRPDERRVYRPEDRNVRPSNPGNTNDNRFERRSNDRGNGNGPNREIRPNDNRPQTEPRQQPVRRPEYDRPAPQRQPQVERRQEPRQQTERRFERPQQQPQQVERRQEHRQPSTRQPENNRVERRDDGNRQQGGGNRGGNDNGGGRFSRR